MKVTFRIKRFDPEKDRKPYFRDYGVEIQEGSTILDCLNQIRWEKDGTLSFRRSCRSAICGSCAMTINKVSGLACYTQIQELKSTLVVIEPLRGFPVIKDLVVEMDGFFRKLEAVLPYLICKSSCPQKEILQSPEEHRLIAEVVNCILCGACTSSCPRAWWDPDYLGPAALLKAYRFIFDSRDEGEKERLKEIDGASGVFRCRTIFNCVEACPKKLNPTEAISALKRRVLLKEVVSRE